MTLMCWSRTVTFKMASRSYLGFTVKGNRAKAAKAAFYETFLQHSAFFLCFKSYSPTAYMSPRVSAHNLEPEIALQSFALRRCCGASEGCSCEPRGAQA